MTFCKEELETHIWYDPINDETWIETNVKRHITKVLKGGWTITQREFSSYNPDVLVYVQAKCKGFGASIRNMAK